jgi:hypothetical protein
MDKEQIIEKLAEIGVITTNVYPKSSFPQGGEINVGLFKREMLEDFYFFNSFDKKIYQFPKPDDINKYEKNVFNGNTKYLIPLHECTVVWEDKPFVELPDLPYRDMTLRHYAAIQLRQPNSGLDWLDVMIKEANSFEVNFSHV